jgi:transcriptional regulator with XRE-family HTH domain
MNTRLKQFLAAENISQSHFADTIKVVRASVSHVLSGRNNPSYEFIKAIMVAYPHLNMEWLLVGKGRMYKESTTVQEVKPAEPSYAREDLLFADEEEDDLITTAPESPITMPVIEDIASARSLSDIDTSKHITQMPIKQRNVSKIIIMFDDGTYQEM